MIVMDGNIPSPPATDGTWGDIGHPVERGVFGTLASSELHNQDRHWSRHAERYDEVFLDPFAPGVENPLWAALDAMPDAAHKTAADLGCGTGPLLPHLAARFERVIALDFAPGMIERARERLAPGADDRVTFLQRPMHEIDDLAGQVDVAVAINSLVMPDVRLIDRTLRGIRATLKPGGQFLGIVPSIDAIVYHTMLLMDQAPRTQRLDPRRKPSGSPPSRPSAAITTSPSGASGSRACTRNSGSPSRSSIASPRPASPRSHSGRSSGPGTSRLPSAEELAGFPRKRDWFFRVEADAR